MFYFWSPAPDYPDIEIVVGVGGLSGDLSGTIRNMLGITDEFHRIVYRDLIGKPAFGLVPVLLRPNSRGRISLKSRNPFHWPRMEPNFFQNQTDVETLIKGIRAVILINIIASMLRCLIGYCILLYFDFILIFSA